MAVAAAVAPEPIVRKQEWAGVALPLVELEVAAVVSRMALQGEQVEKPDHGRRAVVQPEEQMLQARRVVQLLVLTVERVAVAVAEAQQLVGPVARAVLAVAVAVAVVLVRRLAVAVATVPMGGFGLSAGRESYRHMLCLVEWPVAHKICSSTPQESFSLS